MKIPLNRNHLCALAGEGTQPEKRLFFRGFIAAILLLPAGSSTVSAQIAPPLGTAQKFAVLAASTVTNTGGSVLMGDLGVSPGSAITGFPPGTVTGTIHAADAVAAQGQADALTAFNFLSGEACNTILTGTNLGGLTLPPGVYCFASSAQLTGTMTLDATSNPNGVFVFKIGSTLTTASNSAIVVLGGSACNVYFQVGSSATLGTGTQFLGSIFASASITSTTSASISGGAYALNGAVTLDTNPVAACMGAIQVCKVAGSGITIGTNFAFDVGGTPITVAAGASPAGTCSSLLTVPSRPTTITETIPAGTTLASVSTLPGPGLLISSNLAAGSATVTVNPGGQTTVTFIDTIPPIIPTTGFLQICKIAGSGVTLGTPFTFQVAGTNVVVAAGAAPGNCSTPLTVPAGQALIAEVLPAGTTLTNVSTLPSPGLLVSSNLAAGTATVTINAGAQTIAIFTDTVVPTTGFLQVCKVAGNGIAQGTNFTFNVAGNPVVVPAGPAPLGSCSPQIQLPAGQAVVTETIPAGTLLASISTSPPAALVSSNLSTGSATVTITAGGLTTATFTNTIVPVPTTGLIQVCKVAGAGIALGTPFTFNVGGTPVTVPAGPAPGGSCSPPLVAPVGVSVITETIPSGTTLVSVTTLPAGALVSSNLAAGTANVTVTGGGQTVATFIDTIIPPVPTTGFIQVCKVAGAGVAVGTNFTFNVGGTSVTVPAGPAPGGSCNTPLTVTAGPILITETLPAGITLTSVSTSPPGLLVSSNLAAGMATVTVNAGGQTIATFIDTIIPPVPTTGFIQVCKVAGAGVAVGTNFTFNVGGTPVIIPAGPAPLGTCSSALIVTAGATVVTETLPVGTTLTSVTTSPAGLLISSNLSAGTATVTVNAGGQTIVTFLDTAVPATGMLQVCKAAGTGVAVGTNFTFNLGGTSVTVPAGPPPGGSCSPILVVPAGATVIRETLLANTTLASVLTSPPGALASINLAAGTATVTVGAGLTTATFTNTSSEQGLLKVCKISGSGITPGAVFTFFMAGTNFSIPAGFCVKRGTYPPGTVVTITEMATPKTAVSAISVLPAARQGAVDLPGRTITATIGVGVTEVYFTNVAIP